MEHRVSEARLFEMIGRLYAGNQLAAEQIAGLQAQLDEAWKAQLVRDATPKKAG